ncbi:MAG: hypothetical protein HN411_05965 [Waddliaceae bacterium]|nr:hypothetical protein [Waddliaceae bacterium]
MLVRASVFFSEGTSLCSQLQELDKQEEVLQNRYTKARAWTIGISLTAAIAFGFSFKISSALGARDSFRGTPATVCAAGLILSCSVFATSAFCPTDFGCDPKHNLKKKDLVRVARKIQSIDVMLRQQSGITDGERTQMSEAKEMFSTKLERMKAKYSGGLNITREALERQLTAKLLKDRSEGVQVQQVLPV